MVSSDRVTIGRSNFLSALSFLGCIKIVGGIMLVGLLACSDGSSNVDGGSANCEPTGKLAPLCDPIGLTGCDEDEACYLLPPKGGTGCACPGTVPEGQLCESTHNCEPGFICSAFTPPPICKRACQPAATNCSTGYCCPDAGLSEAGFQCVAVADYPNLGTCLLR